MNKIWLCVAALSLVACSDDPEVETIPDPPGMISCPPTIHRAQGPPGPEKLSDTGLYADIEADATAASVMELEVAYPLWSDAAEKRRWLSLPDGEQIDTADMDNWVFPVGTKVWKEFTRNGIRVETRMMEKTEDGRWFSAAYIWDGSDALANMDGSADAGGTTHDVPGCGDCGSCHSKGDKLLGVSAIQLAHDQGQVNVASLLDDDRLTVAPPDPTIPGDADAVAALGYLHSNCGNCHNDGFDKLPLRTWLNVDALGSVEATPTHATTVGQESKVEEPLAGTAATLLVAPGDAANSLLYLRMDQRGAPGEWPPSGMPFIGSEEVDADGTAAVAAWINGM